MNHFVQHIPSFVDTDAPKTTPFETTEDLLALEIVKRYGKEPGFSHFAMSGNILMEISDDGFKWWAVGYVEKPDEIKLPKWDGGKYRARMPNGQGAVLTAADVAWTCGDRIALKDGTMAKNLRP